MRLPSFTIVLFALAACSDDGSNPGQDGTLSGPPCEQLAQRMCNAARECADDVTANSACRWSYGANGTSNGLGRNCAVCEGGLVDLFCEDSTKTAAMVDECAAALDTAVCEPSNGRPAVSLPDACNAVMECNDGPCTQ